MSRFPNMQRGLRLATLAVLVSGAVLTLSGQPLEIGIIDLYGLTSVSSADVRAALTFKEGDTLALADGGRPEVLRSSEERVAKLPGVAGARIHIVCCDSAKLIVYVGVQERGAPALRFHPAPKGAVRLPAETVQAGREFLKALFAAVQRGDAEEDRVEGHSLMRDPTARAIQQQFVVFARRDLATLRLVLRNSSDAAERALAAQLLGYASDKRSVVGDLVRAIRDPAEDVRNNAMRALMVMADAGAGLDAAAPPIPAAPFIELINSPEWTDRNKAAMALAALSARRDRKMLSDIRKSALRPLIEMARWKSEGHAQPAFMILARLAGYPDEVSSGIWDRGDREAVIEAVLGIR